MRQSRELVIDLPDGLDRLTVDICSEGSQHRLRVPRIIRRCPRKCIAQGRRRERAQSETPAVAEQRIYDQLGVASHELRNSLGILRMGFHLMETRCESGRADQARTVVERQLEQMSRLIDDLMQVTQARSGAPRLRREHIDFGVVVRHAIDCIEAEIVRRRHRLVVTLPRAPVWMIADAGRLQQVLMNLLDNAAKFTDDGGELRVTVEANAAWATLRVADTGVGIAPGELSSVFDPFRQGSVPLSHSGSGIGIGLAVVRNLVRYHGGCVIARSAGPGQGSEFEVRLPTVPHDEASLTEE